jgi:hypothetical protein
MTPRDKFKAVLYVLLMFFLLCLYARDLIEGNLIFLFYVPLLTGLLKWILTALDSSY